MRLVWVLDAGWPHPSCNRTVFATSGEILGRPDLLDLTTGVVGEYNGALHRGRARHRSDVARMRAARERAGRGTSPCRWTTDPPPGALVPAEMTLDEELDLRGWPAD